MPRTSHLKSPIELKSPRLSRWEVFALFFHCSNQLEPKSMAIYIDWAQRSYTPGWWGWGLLFGCSMTSRFRDGEKWASQQRELESTQELELSTRERSRDGITKPWGYWQSSLIGRNLTFSDRLLWSQRPRQVFIVLKELRSPPSPPPSFFSIPSPSFNSSSFVFLHFWFYMR